MWWIIAGGVIVVVAVAWVASQAVSRTTRGMDPSAPDIRRADDGGDPPVTDLGSPMG